jgi:hypothetical protein
VTPSEHNSGKIRRVVLGVTISVLLASTGIFAFLYLGAVRDVTTTTDFTTSTIIAGTSTLTYFPSSQLYDVTFYDGGPCPGMGLTEWGVQLGNLTLTAPSNISPSGIPENGINASGKLGLTTLTFSVPSGTYPFTLYPTAFLRPLTPNPSIGDLHDANGVLTVTNSSVTVETFAAIPIDHC